MVALTWPFALPLLREGVYVGNGTDLYSYQLPMRRLVVATLERGEWPLWNPWMLTGVPLLGAWQLGLLYPPVWPTHALGAVVGLDAGLALDLDRALHGAWLALGGLALGNALRPGRLLVPSAPGLAVAALLVGSGVTWGHIYAGHVSFLAVWSWLPWCWALSLRAVERGPRPWLPTAMVAWAMALLAGHPQLVLFGGVGLGLATLALTMRDRPAASVPGGEALAGRARWFGHAVVRGVAIAAGAGALAAAQLLPTATLVGELNRSLDSEQALGLAFSPPVAALLTLLDPFAYGLPEAKQAGFSWHEAVGAVSPALLALALIGWRRAWLAGCLLAAAGLMALVPGSSLPVLPGLIELLPPLGAFRVPSRWWVAVTLLLAIALAAVVGGLVDREAEATTPRVPRRDGDAAHVGASRPSSWLRWGWLGPAALAALAVGLAAALEARPSWFVAALAGQLDEDAIGAVVQGAARRLALVALFSAGIAIAAGAPRARRAVVVLALCLATVDGWRLALAVQPADRMWPPGKVDWPPGLVEPLRLGSRAEAGVDAGRVITAPQLRQANWGGAHGVALVGGYETALPLWTNRYFNSSNGRPQERYLVNLQLRRASPWLDRAGARLLLRRAEDRATAEGFAGWRTVASAAGFALQGNDSAMPRLSVAAKVEVEPDRGRAVERLGTLPPSVTLVDRPLAGAGHDFMGVERRQGSGEALRLTGQGNAWLEAEVRLATPGVLILRDAMFPGWTAEIDDAPTEIAVADGLFRAIAVPAGVHKVRFHYDPPGWTLGLAIALAAWLAVALWLWKWRVREP